MALEVQLSGSVLIAAFDAHATSRARDAVTARHTRLGGGGSGRWG